MVWRRGRGNGRRLRPPSAGGPGGGWAYGSGLAMLALAWASCGAVAYAAIRRGAVALHRRWMVRSYVVTFAFVIYRLVADVLPTAQLKPASDLAIADRLDQHGCQ